MPACHNTNCEFVAEKNVTFGVLRFYAARELTVRVTIGFRYLRSWLVSQFLGPIGGLLAASRYTWDRRLPALVALTLDL